MSDSADLERDVRPLTFSDPAVQSCPFDAYDNQGLDLPSGRVPRQDG